MHHQPYTHGSLLRAYALQHAAQPMMGVVHFQQGRDKRRSWKRICAFENKNVCEAAGNLGALKEIMHHNEPFTAEPTQDTPAQICRGKEMHSSSMQKSASLQDSPYAGIKPKRVPSWLSNATRARNQHSHVTETLSVPKNISVYQTTYDYERLAQVPISHSGTFADGRGPQTADRHMPPPAPTQACPHLSTQKPTLVCNHPGLKALWHVQASAHSHPHLHPP